MLIIARSHTTATADFIIIATADIIIATADIIIIRLYRNNFKMFETELHFFQFRIIDKC